MDLIDNKLNFEYNYCMEHLEQRLSDTKVRIGNLKNKTARRDLTKMHNTVLAIFEEISRESVECRRMHKTTARYEKLILNATDQIDHLEKYLVFACLMAG
jgi:hypothetical protein